MFDALILVILSMLAGGAVVQQGGIKSLSIPIAGILMCLIFYGGILGLIIGILGIFSILVMFFISGWNKPISRLYVNKSSSKDMNQESKIDLNLSQQYQDSFKRGLDKKYPKIPSKDQNWGDRIRRNLQVGLKEKYGDLKPELSSK